MREGGKERERERERDCHNIISQSKLIVVSLLLMAALAVVCASKRASV